MDIDSAVRRLNIEYFNFLVSCGACVTITHEEIHEVFKTYKLTTSMFEIPMDDLFYFLEDPEKRQARAG